MKQLLANVATDTLHLFREAIQEEMEAQCEDVGEVLTEQDRCILARDVKELIESIEKEIPKILRLVNES